MRSFRRWHDSGGSQRRSIARRRPLSSNILQWIEALFFSCVGVSCLKADALFSEGFDYFDGELQVASSNLWAQTQIDDANPELSIAGGKLNWDFTGQVAEPPNNGYYGAVFDETGISSGVLYTYFDLEVTEAPIGSENTAGIFLGLWNGSGGVRSRVFLAAVPDGDGSIVPDRFRLGITKQSGSRFDAIYYPSDWAEGTTLTVLTKSDFDTETVSLFINPESEDDPSVVASDGSFLTIKGVAVRHRDESEEGENIGVFRIDNLVATQTFGDFEEPPDLSPNRLAAAGVPGAVSINWNDRSRDESGFRIERRLSGNSEYEALAIADPNRTHFLDETASMGLEYEYRVVALSESELPSDTSVVASLFQELEPLSPLNINVGFTDPDPYVFNAAFSTQRFGIYEIESSQDLQDWKVIQQFVEMEDDESGSLFFGNSDRESFVRVNANRFSVPVDSIGLTEPFRLPENQDGSDFNLLDFGATSNDSDDDDAQAFRSALDVMEFGDKLEIPGGLYHLKSTILVPSGMTIYGENSPELRTTGIDIGIQLLPGIRDVTLSSFAIIGSDESLSYAVSVGAPDEGGAERIWIKDLRLEGFLRNGVRLRSTRHVKVEGCRISGAKNLGGGGFGYGVALNDAACHENWIIDCSIGPLIRHGILIQFSAHNNLVERNLCLNTTLDAYDLHGEDEYANELRFNSAIWDGDPTESGKPAGFGIGNTGATHDNSGPNNWIHNNFVQGYSKGVEVIQGSHIQFIDGNELIDNLEAGIKIHNGGGNSIYARRNAVSGSETGIQVQRSAANLVLENNVITGNGTGIITSSDIIDYRIRSNDLRGNDFSADLGSAEGDFSNNLE